MKIAIAMLSVLLSAQMTWAVERIQVCRSWYESEVYTGYLSLSVSEPQVPNTPKILWRDTHIPYGIRPMPYEIADMTCENNGIKIFATGPTYDALFVFQAQANGPEFQPGKLNYIGKDGKAYPAQSLECSPEAMQRVCALP